ncbi:MAG TPA: diguanylate cyclase [Gammaproteobacteria bacterium]|nr:diguanylate cyclase [Gammaproteobacteria bacterium]
MSSTNDNDTKPRILVVDDSRVMRRAVTKILGNDYDVIEAEHGEDAWTLLTNDETIQVVFSDLSMPYLDGYGLLAKVRSAEDERLQDIPVIIITGKEDDEAAKTEALAKGATDFITKPFDSVQLLARAKAHVKFEQTSRKLSKTAATLEMEAAIDSVTGLGTKVYFTKSANETLAYAKRHGHRLILVRLDVDNFNTLFLKNGKEAANSILEHIGKIFSGSIRQEDKAARVGLASFACLLQSTMLEGAQRLAERVRHEIAAKEFVYGEHQMRTTVSIGLAEPALRHDTTVDDMLQAAEANLAAAVNAGGNRVVSDSAAAQPAPPAAEQRAHPEPDLEGALSLLQEGRQDELEPYAASLVHRMAPLMTFLANHAKGELQKLLKALNTSN